VTLDFDGEDESEILARTRIRRERDRAVAEAAGLARKLEQLERVLNLVEAAEGSRLQPPVWLTQPRSTKTHRGTLALLLSDMHFDEVVEPDEMDGLNAYSRRIAELRLERWTRNSIKLARHHLTGVTYDGALLMLGGDSFTGDIHEELTETNDDTILGSLLHWSELLAAAVTVMAGEFGKLHVVVVVGNHGRMSRKPRSKLKAKTNFDWLLGKMLERHFATDRRVTFQIPTSPDAWFEVYGHGQLLTHGDQVKGGAGIGGIWPPLMRLRARKTQRHMAIGKPFETLWCGHWHQLVQTPGLIINGSTKGYDEYARDGNFSYEVPQQALAVITPEHGITWQAPVLVQDRKSEGW